MAVGPHVQPRPILPLAIVEGQGRAGFTGVDHDPMLALFVVKHERRPVTGRAHPGPVIALLVVQDDSRPFLAHVQGQPDVALRVAELHGGHAVFIDPQHRPPHPGFVLENDPFGNDVPDLVTGSADRHPHAQ